ncbi:hypothetical protein OUZ56_026107 [Daphnia magna]|uniref:Uncharacterized protein n=1 Tax=Daphnia magna TaxID=35525 RepID=A0ABQ9ZLA2_9CRUS|nr:hypothetical protein OUZ56_026107 [Daphnia magna]
MIEQLRLSSQVAFLILWQTPVLKKCFLKLQALPIESQEVETPSPSHEDVNTQVLAANLIANQTQELSPVRRILKRPVRWNDESTNKFYAKLAAVGLVKEPKNFKCAVESPQSDQWNSWYHSVFTLHTKVNTDGITVYSH